MYVDVPYFTYLDPLYYYLSHGAAVDLSINSLTVLEFLLRFLETSTRTSCLRLLIQGNGNLLLVDRFFNVLF